MNVAMKEKYFDNGLRELLSDEYYYVGVMLGIALLQNGQLPTFMPVDVIEKLRHRYQRLKEISNRRERNRKNRSCVE